MIPLSLDVAIKEYEKLYNTRGVNHSVIPSLLEAGLSDSNEQLMLLKEEVEFLRKREKKAIEIMEDVYSVATKRDVGVVRRMIVKFLDEVGEEG